MIYSADTPFWSGTLDIILAACKYITGTDLHGQFDVLSHWNKMCKSTLLSLIHLQYADTGPTSPSRAWTLCRQALGRAATTVHTFKSLVTAVQGLRFSCYSWAPEPRHPVHVTDVYATESRTPLVRELSADRFSVGLLLHCSPPSRVRAGEWAKVCGGKAPLWSAASAEKQRIFFLFRLQPTRHRYSLAHSTAHMSSGQSTKWHQTQ